MLIAPAETAPPADLTPAADDATAIGKWGRAIGAGFQTVPDMLIKHQRTLELSATDLVVLLNLLMHWWYAGRNPFPRPTTIAARMGVDVRTVQRSIRHLSEQNLIARVTEEDRTTYDLSGLVGRLETLALNDANYRERRVA